MPTNESQLISLEEFYMFLRSKGLNENGAKEVINRFNENRPDREDLSLYKQFAPVAVTLPRFSA